ncbi:AraC family transcriptional regulator [Novosphingobium lindaniclasticum]|uniref:AraC family transcriptional regulator n=1 Tax=Novosphingobium lindaniclasticum TaxID=1329895 RepID=UPI00042969D1|nr:AraC family transcriptional regulator [Novosphingobium lindaniclasticum]
MTSPTSLSLAVRSYGAESTMDRHGFAQIVLPLEGTLSMEIGGRGAAILRGDMAFVDADMRHDQISEQPNRAFILDLDPRQLAPHLREELGRRPYGVLTPAANKLVEFMALLAAQPASGDAAADVLQPMIERWAPLFFETLAGGLPQARLRLAALLERVEAEPGRRWTASAMAAQAGMGVSRLHELFREELGTTPRGWLSDLRLKRVREAMAAEPVSIAELAYRFGYSDQSALTRAMRKATGLTPAAYRRQMRDEGLVQGPETRSRMA